MATITKETGVWTKVAGPPETWVKIYPKDAPVADITFALRTGYTVTHTGGTATLTGGKVTFAGVTSLSLDGVFTADYTDYVISMYNVGTGNNNILGRLRSAGTDANAANYVWQYLDADGGSVAAARYTTSNWRVGTEYSTARTGDTVHLYGPFLAQPTAYRLVDANGWQGATLADAAGTHSLGISYDGFTFYTTGSTITGSLTVYGVRM